VQRGPYVIAGVMDESVSEEPLTLTGPFVDLFDPTLPVVASKIVKPDERALLYDLAWPRRQGLKAKVVAAAARVRDEQSTPKGFQFVTRGPKATRACVRIWLPHPPVHTGLEPAVPFDEKWDPASSTLWLSFDNAAQDCTIRVAL